MLLPGQSLRGRLPLLSTAFRHSNLRRQVPPRLHDAIDNSSEGWNYGREYCLVNLAEMTTSTSFWDLYMQQITTWNRRLYFSSEGRRAEDFFFALKVPKASAGFEPAKSNTRGQHAYPRPPKPSTKQAFPHKYSLIGVCNRNTLSSL